MQRPPVVNIGPRGQRRRLALGFLTLSLGAAFAASLVALHARPGWFLLAFPLFFVGLLGVFQAREGT